MRTDFIIICPHPAGDPALYVSETDILNAGETWHIRPHISSLVITPLLLRFVQQGQSMSSFVACLFNQVARFVPECIRGLRLFPLAFTPAQDLKHPLKTRSPHSILDPQLSYAYTSSVPLRRATTVDQSAGANSRSVRSQQLKPPQTPPHKSRDSGLGSTAHSLL